MTYALARDAGSQHTANTAAVGLLGSQNQDGCSAQRFETRCVMGTRRAGRADQWLSRFHGAPVLRKRRKCGACGVLTGPAGLRLGLPRFGTCPTMADGEAAGEMQPAPGAGGWEAGSCAASGSHSTTPLVCGRARLEGEERVAVAEAMVVGRFASCCASSACCCCCCCSSLSNAASLRNQFFPCQEVFV